MLEVKNKMRKKVSYYKEKVFKAENQELSLVQEFVKNTLLEYGCNAKVIMQISLAMEELFVNIANYAYSNGEGICRVTIDYDGEKKVMITVEDSGIPFNPLEKDEPNITLSAEEREVGGLGIFITKKIMDQIEYQYENQKNKLKMTKIIS